MKTHYQINQLSEIKIVKLIFTRLELKLLPYSIFKLEIYFFIFQEVVLFEEKQASDRDENSDSTIYFNTLRKWQDIMKWTHDLKNKDTVSVSCIIFILIQ